MKLLQSTFDCPVTNIDELKEGFAFSENSLLQHKMNELYLLIKMINSTK
jgi:hypothetical protein